MNNNLEKILKLMEEIGFQELEKQKILFKGVTQKELYEKGLYKKYRFKSETIDFYIDAIIDDEEFKTLYSNLFEKYKFMLRKNRLNYLLNIL